MDKPNPIQLSIPNPCNEDWEQMTSDERGRFCSHCQKSVVDFTGWTDNQIHQYIKAHAGERICGRVHILQTNRLLYPAVPLRKRPVATQWLAAGFVLLLSITPARGIAFNADYTEIVQMQEDKHDGDSSTISIKGQVRDSKNNKAAEAKIYFVNFENITAIGFTNLDGEFNVTLDTTDTSSQFIRLLIRYPSHMTKSVFISKKETSKFQLITLMHVDDFPKEIITGEITPIIDPFEPTKRTITSEEIEKMAH